MNKKQEQQILDYYSTTDKYIRSKTHSNAHQTVFTKESDKYQWLVLEQKIQCGVEVRQTDNHGTITARDNYELTGNLPKCVGVERLCEGANFQIPFNADEVNLIYQFGEQRKAETGASLSAILPQIKDSDTKQIVSDTLKKLNALSKETCAELTATLYTRDKAVMRKPDTLVADYPDTYMLIGQDEVSKTYSFPKSHISYRKPRTVSAEQRERARQMMIERNKRKEY